MKDYVVRYLEQCIVADLKKKMVFVAGPRQVGKTTMAQNLCHLFDCQVQDRYLNWDIPEDRELIMLEQFPAGSGLLILDEIHKYDRWRQIVKGLYDKRGHELNILVTGSARLDYYRHGGDSLQGRYHFYRLHPFSYREILACKEVPFSDLVQFGSFPEPFVMRSERDSRRWSREYRVRMVRGDLRDLERVFDLDSIERLVLRLPELVGSPLSINALREDLSVSHQSVARWLSMLENLYMIFRIYPFGASHIRAVKKEAKHYHIDWTLVPESGPQFENVIACHLLKWVHYMIDYEGRNMELRYFRDIDRREVDFVLCEDEQPIHFIETKVKKQSPDRSLKYIRKKFPTVPISLITLDGDRDVITKDSIRICPAHIFLKEFI